MEVRVREAARRACSPSRGARGGSARRDSVRARAEQGSDKGVRAHGAGRLRHAPRPAPAAPSSSPSSSLEPGAAAGRSGRSGERSAVGEAIAARAQKTRARYATIPVGARTPAGSSCEDSGGAGGRRARSSGDGASTDREPRRRPARHNDALPQRRCAKKGPRLLFSPAYSPRQAPLLCGSV